MNPRPRPAAGLARYALVGAVATALHYALLVVLVERAGWPPWLAAATGSVAGAQLAFVGNRRFTFGHGGPLGRAWVRFQLTAGLGAAVSATVVAAGVAVGLHYLLAQALATVLAMLLTYTVNRRWTFSASAGPG